MSEKHTPGPWHAVSDTVYAGSHGQRIVADCDVGSASRHEREANARLSAAAPALLEAAKHARTCVPFPSDCHDKLVAAITQAVGGEA